MSYIYEPEVAKEEDGYSIPKILVALLLLIVIGAGYYIFNQKKKLADSTAFLLKAKKEAIQDLTEMERRYTLAIDNNEFLADELIEERKKIIEMRNSVDNLTEDDFNGVTNFRQRIQDMAETTNFVTAPAEIPENIVVNTSSTEIEAAPQESPSNKQDRTAETKSPKSIATADKKTPKTRVTPPSGKVDKIASSESSIVVDSAESSLKDATIESQTPTETIANIEKETTVEKAPEIKKVVTATTLGRVEIPPTFPGCNGDAASKKKCFNNQIRKFVSSKFDPSISDEMDLSPGKKRVFVMFNVDKQGRVVNIRARAEHKTLEDEAIRVVKQLPKMLAARQNGNAVGIRNYTVPITFVVEDN